MDVIFLILIIITMMVEGIDSVTMKKMNMKSSKMEETLFESDEDSLLQCAQRCKFMDKDAVIDYRNSRCSCIRYKTNDELENHGTLMELFVTQRMKMPKIDGGLSTWKNSTSCTKTCGNGTLEQLRHCDSPRPENGGSDCKGVKNRTVECNTHRCPVNGRWSSWKNATECTKVCGNGTLEQMRHCDSPKPENGGANCEGIQNRTVECNSHGCLDKWKNITSCNVSCEGDALNQTSHCDSFEVQHGGYYCTEPANRTVQCKQEICRGNLTRFFNPKFNWENGHLAIFGYIAIYRKGIWGTICDDHFGEEDAKVLCRMSGNSGGAFDHGKYRVGDGKIDGVSRYDLKIWIDDLHCKGNELTVDDCPHRGWGSHNCYKREDVGIKCFVP